jgi:DNA repair protein RadC
MHSDSLYTASIAENAAPTIRERLASEGPVSLSDSELIAALIGTGMQGKGVRTLAEEVLRLLDSSRSIPDPATLRGIGGMGEAKACAVAAALELGRRVYGSRETRVASPRDIWPIVSHWADRKQERFICCSLNGAHELIAARIVSVGLVNRTVVHPREVFADPLTDRACAVVIAVTQIPLINQKKRQQKRPTFRPAASNLL